MNNNHEVKRVLCIDDDVVFLEKTQKSLKKIAEHVFEIEICSSAQEALNLLKKGEIFDCILLDYLMPDMDGIEFLTELRNKPVDFDEKTPVIILTNHGDESVAVKALKMGAADYFIKSRVSAQLLQDIILAAIQKRESISTLKVEDIEINLYRDPLTQSLNHDGFIFFLDKKISDLNQAKKQVLKTPSRDRVLGVLCINVENFKFVNSYGHHIGDILLIDIVRILFNILPAGSQVARLSGDTFAVMLTAFDGYYEIGEWGMKIQRNLSRSYEINQNRIFIKVRVGISCYPQDSDSAEDLLNKAEIALANLRKENGSVVNYFTPYMLDEFNRKNNIIDGLRVSIDNDEMELVFQPIVNAESKKIIGSEALLRWKSADLGEIFPSEFIAIAESAGLAIKIGNWVLMKSVEELAEWRDKKLVTNDFVMSVNVSLLQFIDADFYNYVNDLLKEHKVPGNCLQLEITETQAYELWKNRDIAKQFFDLDSNGIKLAIDDFGTGFSSFSRLSDLPISTLKIDKYFIDSILRENSEETGSTAILKSIIDLGKNMNLKVVCEGVEKEEQLEFLLKSDSPIIQGFIFSHPLNEQEFEEFLINGIK